MTDDRLKRAHLASNLLSFAAVAACGLVVNILLVRVYGKETLGAFNQALAVFFVVSQFSTFGMHQSVLSTVAVSAERERVVFSALLGVGLSSLAAFGLLYAVAATAYVPGLSGNFAAVAVATAFFSINKVLIFALNGMGYLHRFALANALRLVFMLAALLGYAALGFDAGGVAAILPAAEILVFLSLLPFFAPFLSVVPLRGAWQGTRGHFGFGRYALASGLIVELNTKVDVILLGFFARPAEIGIYSFAMLLGEGFHQLVVLFRALDAKDLSLRIHRGEGESPAGGATGKRAVFFIAACAVTAVLFRPFARLATGDGEIVERGFWIYLMYAASVAACAPRLLLDQVFILARRPEIDNRIRAATFFCNFLLGLVLVPRVGILGAAVALSASVFVNAGMVAWLIRKHRPWNGGTERPSSAT